MDQDKHTVEIAGIAIDCRHLNLTQVIKQRVRDGWILMTKKGVEVARFKTKQELFNWWVSYVDYRETCQRRRRKGVGSGDRQSKSVWIAQSGQGGNRYLTRGWERHA